MKLALGFVIGALIGAAIALIYAPYSGEELRTNIKIQVDEQSAKVQKQLDKMSGEVQALEEQSIIIEPVA